MKKMLWTLAMVCIVFLFAAATSDRGNIPNKFPELKSHANLNPSVIHVDFGNIPLYFTANRGQVDGKALFYAKASRYTLWLTEGGLVFDSFKAEKAEPAVSNGELSLRPEKTAARKFQREVSRLVFLNAAKHPEIVAVDETPLKVNYFIGNDPKKWHTAVPTSGAVLYKNIYKNIDLKVYGSEGRIEYDWIVKPGGDPRDIRFQYENVKRTRLDREGNLLVATCFGELMHKKPVAYQQGMGSGNGSRATVESTFKKIGKNSYGFAVGVYDAGLELVIDPVVLAYSTYLGGNGSTHCYGIAVDNSGNAYVTGYTSSTDFPTRNQFQLSQGMGNAFVTKLDTTQSGDASLVYSTYLGGSNTDQGYGIAADDDGNAYVIGETFSTNFPTLKQYQTVFGGGCCDAFVTKLDTTQSGNASLVYSTYLGGNSSDSGYGMAIDKSGNAYVTGRTYSTNFPTLNQYQSYTSGMYMYAFVTKIDTTQSGNASLVYSTYLGENAFCRGIAADDNGNAYVTGPTWNMNFPTLNQYQLSQGGGDAFVTKLDTTQSGNAGLIYSSYLGGSNADDCYGIAADGYGNAYVTGATASTDFPTLNQYQTGHGGGYYDAFITKFDTTKNGNASLVYSTYLGGSGTDEGKGIAVKNSGNAYVTGYTWSTNFPTLNQFQTDQGERDAFVTKLDTTQSGNASLIYSTYLGGNDADLGWGIALDSSGNGYVTGITISTDFPTVNQFQTAQNTFISKISFNAEIAVTKTSSNLAPKVGENFNFIVTVTNNGPLAATGLQLSDPLPAGLAYASSIASTGTYTLATGIWNIGALANGATATLTLTVQGTAPGGVTNTASVTALTENDPDLSNNSASAGVTIAPLTHTLTIAASVNGRTSPEAGTYTHDEGTAIMILASPATGYRFENWSGDASGSANPLTLVIDRDRSIKADFVRVLQPPLALSGEKLVNRNVSMVEYIARLKWQPNPANAEPIGYRIYQIENGRATAIAEVGAGKYEYIVRKLQATKTYRFGVTAVNGQGWESDMAQVTVQ